MSGFKFQAHMFTEAELDRVSVTSGARSRTAEHPPASMETVFVDPRSEPEWDRWVQAHPDSGFFHCAGWAKVLSKTYSHQPYYLRLVRNGETATLVPMMEVRSSLTGRRGICLPFTDSCAPLVFEPTAASAIVETLAAVARERKWKYFEVRGSLSPDSDATPSVEFLVHTLALTGGVERLFAGFASPVRRAIRKAEKSGVTVAISQSRDAVMDFYRLHARTRRRHGLPPQPLAFFLNIHDEIVEAGAGFTVIASKEGRPVAGAVFFQFGRKAIYKFGASIDEGQESRANNLVMSEGIKFLAARGCETLHFGRTSLANEGLRRFKLGWGAQEQKLGYFKFDPEAGRWLTGRDNASGLHNAVFRRLPLFANRLAGAMIYPHLD